MSNKIIAAALLCSLSAFGADGAASSAPAKPSGKTILYASVGPELTIYSVDIVSATLTRRGSLTLPANVQEAVVHPSKKLIYIAWSDGGASYTSSGSGAAPKGSHHGVTAFRIDPATGALTAFGPVASLPSRPIHITIDAPGTHILTAYNDPSSLTVHKVNADGTLGAQVPQAGGLDTGIYAHNIRVDPSNKIVFLVTRGNGPTPTKAEDPGAVKVFAYDDGKLQNRQSVAPNGGFNFQSRHLDFHPSRPWIFLTLERQNRLAMFEKHPDGTLSSKAAFDKTTLVEPGNIRSGQTTSTIHVHPNGRFVYAGNRASASVEVQGKQVWAGGENSIAVFSINQQTGEPTLIQDADTHGLHPRTFSLDAGGKILIAANLATLPARDGSTIPASLAVFRIKDDGRLDFVRKYGVDSGNGRTLFWSGIVSLP